MIVSVVTPASEFDILVDVKKGDKKETVKYLYDMLKGNMADIPNSTVTIQEDKDA